VSPAIDYGDRLRAGIIVPSGNPVAEPEIRAMLPEGVTGLITRLALRGSSDRELMAMLDGLEDAARLVADAGVATVVFHCTAASTFAPELGGEIRARIERASGVPAFATSDALAAAFPALGATRIALLTPYNDAVHTREIAFLDGLGVEVVADANLGLETNAEMARLSPDELLAWAVGRMAAHADAAVDAVFLSCTALRSAGIVAALEAQGGRPVVTSNQAMVWHLLRTNGVTTPRPGFGRLLA
jgi:maleate isomerase